MYPGLQLIEQKGLIRKRFLSEFLAQNTETATQSPAGLALAIEVESSGLEIAAQVQLQTVARPPGP
jgi:hypothetical protein